MLSPASCRDGCLRECNKRGCSRVINDAVEFNVSHPNRKYLTQSNPEVENQRFETFFESTESYRQTLQVISWGNPERNGHRNECWNSHRRPKNLLSCKPTLLDRRKWPPFRLPSHRQGPATNEEMSTANTENTTAAVTSFRFFDRFDSFLKKMWRRSPELKRTFCLQ